jgi:uncharacterized protein involved in response to NO
MNQSPRISWRAVAKEPFRLFFVAAVVVGIIGVALWPLYFGGLIQFYPGQKHARLMAYGFFGGFIVGFLGTALPRMLSTAPLRLAQVALLFFVYAGMAVALLAGQIVWGDSLFIALLTLFAGFMACRFRSRQDTPPPGFILVLLALACAAAGAVMSIAQNYSEQAFFWGSLQHLLAYQGFMLLPILGVGAFLLPRFFGAESRDDFPETVRPPGNWWQRAGWASSIGALILVSFWMEAGGWLRAGPALRFGVTLVYLAGSVPFYKPAKTRQALSLLLRVALVLLLAGFLANVILPAYRVSLLHLTLIGGFAVITLVVATRVIYGHSGNLPLLARPNRWLWWVGGLMLLAMATRISGDFLPKILGSHYTYGAVVWIIAVLIWSARVLPKVLLRDPEG